MAPTNLQEYLDRFDKSQRYFGVGVETGMSIGCPFCGAPEFMEYRILDVTEVMKRGATCKECGRSAKAIFHVEIPGNKQFEIVQTGGDDPPDWLVPKMRRVGSAPQPPINADKALDHKGQVMCTTSGEPVAKVRAEQTEPTGQHKAYIVLCEEERAKGFVRPYRDRYQHVGALTQLVDDAGADSHAVRAVGCGTVTTMGRSLSETYARDPKFYGSTFCVGCNAHYPVDQFVWTADGAQVGS